MTTPQEVVEAAANVLRGSRLERARAGMTALNLFVDLAAEDKRELAVLVAQRAAPQLVPRIQAEGSLDMTAEQSRAVLDMVRRLDGDDLAEIQAALGSAEARRETMAAVGTAAATATGVDDVVAEPATPTPGDQAVRAPVDDETGEEHRARVRVLEDRVDDLTEQVADARRATSEAQARAGSAEGELQAATARADDAERRVDELERAVDEARHQARRSQEQARAAAAAARRTPPHGAPAGPVARAGAARPGAPRSDVGGTGGRVDVDALARRMTTMSTSAGLRLLVGSASSLGGHEPDQRRQLVTTLPDGWARRRAIQRLVEAGVVTATEAPGLLGTLESTGNQVFAAGTMLATGLAPLDDLADGLSPAAAARLARRTPAR